MFYLIGFIVVALMWTWLAFCGALLLWDHWDNRRSLRKLARENARLDRELRRHP